MRILSEAVAARFAARYPAARKPLQRFLAIAKEADWPHFAALRQTFGAADIGNRTGRVMFDIGGNKYRLIASIDFKEQILVIERVLTHADYSREKF